MSWREAFLRQAQSDNQVRRRLNTPEIENSHRLHYLQMVAEKLAKAGLTNPGTVDPPKASHNAFVRFLQTLKGQKNIQRQLGYKHRKAFSHFVDSLLPQAAKIERLAPQAAGTTLPNPEYPWRDPKTGAITAPADYDFPEFDPSRSEMLRIEKMIDQLLLLIE
jgi:hypothetical protein